MRVFEVRYQYQGYQTARFVVRATSFAEAERLAHEKLEGDMGLSLNDVYITQIMNLGDAK